jgi:HEAT repeat protein
MAQDPAALEILRAALADPEEEVRYRAAEAFTHVYDEGADAALDRMVRDDAQPLRSRQMAAVALGRHGAGTALLSAFGAAPVPLRVTIAGALGDTGDKAVLPGLREREAKESDPDVRAALKGSIERLAAKKR